MVEAEKKALAGGASRVAAIDAVRDYFYRGEIAKKIDEFSRAHGGLLRYDDLASFKLTPEEPISTDFRGARVYKPGFWSQGPAMIETLNLLSAIDVMSMRVNSAQYIHTLTEALKLAYADRDTYYGDPKFVKVPGEELLSMKYADERRKLIGQSASMEFLPGKIEGHVGDSSFAIRDRAHQNRRLPDGARHHLRGCHGQGRRHVLGDSFRRMAALRDCRRHGHSADGAGAEFSSRPGQPERIGRGQAAPRNIEPDADHTYRRPLRGSCFQLRAGTTRSRR